MTGRDRFAKRKRIIMFFVCVLSFFPDSFLNLLLSCFRSLGGQLGAFLRYIVLKNVADSIGDNVYIGPYVVIKNAYGLRLGDNVSVHEFCYLDACGGILIGNNVSIAHSSSIISFDHTFGDSFLPIKYNKTILGEIKIKDDVWIGCGVRLLRSVTINERSIVAAGAVVSSGDYPKNTLIGGVPAKIIKNLHHV